MLSDLRKHPETENHLGGTIGVGMMLIPGWITNPMEVRKWIEGFNCASAGEHRGRAFRHAVRLALPAGHSRTPIEEVLVSHKTRSTESGSEVIMADNHELGDCGCTLIEQACFLREELRNSSGKTEAELRSPHEQTRSLLSFLVTTEKLAKRAGRRWHPELQELVKQLKIQCGYAARPWVDAIRMFWRKHHATQPE